ANRAQTGGPSKGSTTAQKPAPSRAARSLVTSSRPVQSVPPTTASARSDPTTATAYGGGGFRHDLTPTRPPEPLASTFVSAARAGTPGRRSWPQRLLITFNVFLIVTCLVIAGGLGYFNYKFGRLP